MLGRLSCSAILLVVGLGAGVVWAQDDAVKRTILQKTEVPGTPYVTVLGTAEIKAGATVGRHTHPGTESGYVVEGGGELLVQGQPPRHRRFIPKPDRDAARLPQRRQADQDRQLVRRREGQTFASTAPE